MDIAIYVSTEPDLASSEALFQRTRPQLTGAACRSVNLLGAEMGAVPAEVIQVMMLKKKGTFPLTVIDGKPVISGQMPTVDELVKYGRDGVEAPAILVTGGVQ